MRVLTFFLAIISALSIALWFNYERNKLKRLESSVSALHNQLNETNKAIEEARRSTVKDIVASVKSNARLWIGPNEWQAPRLGRADRIAHAGGAYNGMTYTNSIEALNANKNDFNLFEIDLALTSDDRVVCSHDWDHYPKQIFGFDLGKVPTYDEFVKLAKNNEKFTNCTLESLIQWIDENAHASIVTDIKNENLKALEYIATNYPQHRARFIPQIYNMEEYDSVEALGFDRIILTIYAWGAPEEQIIAEAKTRSLFAVTVPDYRAAYVGKGLKDTGQRVYAHTINTKETKDLMRWFGVDEIYTDFYKD